MEHSEIMMRYEQIVLNLLEDNEKLKSHVKKLEAELVRTFNNMMRDADRIEQLEAELHSCFHRIEELQAALQEIAWIATPDHEEARQKATEIARKALEGKDD